MRTVRVDEAAEGGQIMQSRGQRLRSRRTADVRHRPGVGAHVETGGRKAGRQDPRDRIDFALQGSVQQVHRARAGRVHVDVRIGLVAGHDVRQVADGGVEIGA